MTTIAKAAALLMLAICMEETSARPKKPQTTTTCNCSCFFRDDSGHLQSTGIQRVVSGGIESCGKLQGTKQTCVENDGTLHADGKAQNCYSPSPPTSSRIPKSKASAVTTTPSGAQSK